MNSYPFISIVIPHFNNYYIVKECLESLAKLTYPNYEIIVVDNFSSDNSYNLLKDNHDNIKLYKTKFNLGFSGGCNYGAKHATGEFFQIN